MVAGFVPGIVSALVYAPIITWCCWRQPELGPRITGYAWSQRYQSPPGTDEGALGASALFAFALRNSIKRAELRHCLLASAKVTVMIFTVIWGC